MKNLLVAGYLLFTHGYLTAQQFGGNPPSLKWKQINSDTARIIFPEGLDSQANRVAAIIHRLAAENPNPIGSRLKKINIVLQNQTTIANGYVAPGPYRSEFFLTPATDNFDIGSIAWADMLSVHEYRHVMQFNNFRHGISKVMHILFGDDGYSLATAASIPDWFFEGDAVHYETLLSGQGRGRIPQFLNEFPALWQAGKKYSWMKLRNGSYKHYVPNHYALGYLLVNYGYEKYGADLWKNVTRDASAFKGLVYPFQNAVKKYSGTAFKQFREDAFRFYKNRLPNDFIQIPGSREKPVTGGKAKYVIHYQFPFQAGNDSLLYLKSSYREVPAFYIKDSGGEHKLRKRDISADRQFSYRNGKIVYAAYETDPRWTWRDYSVIKVLDINTNQQKRITRQSKYFTPDISPGGSRIAALHIGTDGRSQLHILDAENGNILKTIARPEVQLFTDPKFADDNTLVSAARFTDGRMSLVLMHLESGQYEMLTPVSYTVLGFPFVSKGTVFFTASFSGNDEVMAVRLADKKLFKITGGPLGKYYVHAGDGKLTWSAFTADGYRLMQLDEKEITWSEVDPKIFSELTSAFPVSRSENYRDNFLSHVPGRNFEVKNYSKSTRLINFHSWRPYYEDPEFSFTVYGENILNTLQTEMYYLYNQNDREHAAGMNAVYGGLFPYITLGTQYTFDKETRIGSRIKNWGQLDTRAGLSVPLWWTTGTSFKRLNFGSSYVLRNEFNKGFYKDSLGTISFSYLSHFISWRQQAQMAVQHILPRTGYALSFRRRHVITRYEGFQFYGSAVVYLPGIHATHSLELKGAFQERDTLRQVIFSNLFPYSRGYIGRYFSRMWNLSANYHFPLLHPDWGFGNILYFYRLRANVFYDFTRVYSADKKQSADQRSLGLEFFADTNWWNQYPLTFGFRISRLLDPDQYDGLKGTYFEFIMPVSIIPR